MADVTYIPDGNQANNYLPWMLANNGNGFLGGNGWGGGILGFLLGLFFGNGWGGFGNGFGGFGGGNSGAGFLSNQINNDSGRELLMNAITSSGEASRAAIQNLANTLGQDFNLVNSGVQGIRDGIAALTAQTGMSSLQIINAIQAGDTTIQSKLCECCCSMKQLVTSQGYENQLATLGQTNTLASAITSGNQRVVDAISDLKTTTISEFCAARERDMQSEINRQGDIITQLRNQLDNDRQTSQFAAMIAPIANQVNVLLAKAPQTVPVIWPQLTVTQTTPTTTPVTNGA